MKRILLFNSLYFPNIQGGAERSVQAIAEGLQSKGFEVTVITTADSNYSQVINGVKVYYLKTQNLYWLAEAPQQLFIKKSIWHLIDSYNVFMVKRLDALIEKYKPHIIHTNNLSGISPYLWKIASRHNVPVVHTLRDYYLLCPKSAMFINSNNCKEQCHICHFYSNPKKRLSSYVDGVIGVSDFILQKHLKSGYFKNSLIQKRIFNIFESKSLPYKDPIEKIRFGYAGQLIASKGVELLLNTFAQISDNRAVLKVYGKAQSGKYEEYLKSKYSKKNILFFGFKQPDEIYSNIDVMIIPSLWHEPFPRTLIESFSKGLPVVATNRGGIPEMIIHNKDSFIFDPDEKNSLKNILMKIINNKLLIKSMSEKVLVKSDEFSAENILSQYIKVYDKFL